MLCCFLPSRRSSTYTQNDEKKHLLRSGTTTINYQTILTIPYAHVIRDDKIQIESSNIVDANATDTYLLFNGTLPDQAYEATCFSFDDADLSTPVVFSTTTTNPHFLFERLFQINHVTAISPSTAIRMHQINPTKTTSSNTVSMARPFDEFLTNPTIPNSPLDVQSNSIITKLDKN